MSRVSVIALLGAVVLVSFPAGASGQSLRLTAYGLRAGATLDDELTQFTFGGHADLGRLTPNTRLQPLLTMSVGDGAFGVLAGSEIHYLFPVGASSSRLEPYLGGGVGLSHLDFDGNRNGGSDQTEIALLLTGGVEVPVRPWWGTFFELRFQVMDESIFRAEAGMNWRY